MKIAYKKSEVEVDDVSKCLTPASVALIEKLGYTSWGPNPTVIKMAYWPSAENCKDPAQIAIGKTWRDMYYTMKSKGGSGTSTAPTGPTFKETLSRLNNLETALTAQGVAPEVIATVRAQYILELAASNPRWGEMVESLKEAGFGLQIVAL